MIAVKDEYVLLACIEFTDEMMEVSVLHEGTLDECEKVQNLIPAIVYDGDKEVDKAFTTIRTAREWDEAYDHFGGNK